MSSLPPILKKNKIDTSDSDRLIENPRSKELKNKFNGQSINLNNQNNRYKDNNTTGLPLKPFSKKLDKLDEQ